MNARVISASTVLTGERGETIAYGAVVVVDDKIAWVGASAELPVEYRDLPATDYPESTILPGLIESHAHLTYDGGVTPKPRAFALTRAQQIAAMLKHARQLLNVGVTTVRDLGARENMNIEVRDIIASGLAPGPRMLAAGAQITTTGGHSWQAGARADSVDDVRRVVREHHKLGVDLIKVNATGGFLTAGSSPEFAQFNQGEMNALVEEAHRVGKKVAAHVHGIEGIRFAVIAGVDTLEHCTFVARPGVIEPDLDLIDEIVSKGMYVCATATHNLPAMMEKNPSFAPPVRLLYDKGVKLIAGNDSGIDGVPHYRYVGGLQTLAWFGIPTEEILIAATSRAAEALGLAAVTGRLVAGLSADLIVASGDPLSDLSCLNDLQLVMAQGRVHPTVTIAEMEEGAA